MEIKKRSPIPLFLFIGFFLLIGSFFIGKYIAQAMPVKASGDKIQPTTNSIIPEQITRSSSKQEIALLMLRSDERWKNINFEGVYRLRKSNGSIEESWSSGSIIQASPTGPFKVNLATSLQKGGNLNHKVILDGSTIWDTYPNYKIFTTQLISLGMFPPKILPIVNDPEHPTILHPLIMQVPNPLAELIFPQGMAQQMSVQSMEDKVAILGEDVIAGRKTVVIQFNQDWALKLIFWVDQSTGILLKLQMFDKSGIENNQWGIEIEITDIQFEQVNPNVTFKFDETGYTKVDRMEIDQIIDELKTQ